MKNALVGLGNALKERARRGEASLGSFLLSGNSLMAEALATVPGLHWMLVDMEASHASKEDLLHILQALNAYDVFPLVRVGEASKHLVESCLDFGARGVMVPKVETPEQASAVADACFYPPKGRRGINCIRASAYYSKAAEYLKGANEAILSIAQIESRESVENVEELAAVPALDVLFVGPGDLAASYGQMGYVDGRRMEEARRRVVEACRKHDKIPGIFAHSVESTRQYLDEGFLMVGIGNDVKFLTQGLGASLRQIGPPIPREAAQEFPQRNGSSREAHHVEA